MSNVLDLEPNTIINDTYEGSIKLNAWEGFQSRRGFYGSKDAAEVSDGEVKVFIQGKEANNIEMITESQVKSIKYLFENSYHVRDALLNRLWKDLPNLEEIYADAIPTIKDILDFKDVLGLSNIHVMSSEKDAFSYIGFELGCEWDEEHGVGVMMHKKRVVAIGQADTAFDDWVTFDDNGTTEIETKKWDEANERVKTNSTTSNKPKPWWKFW
jgi:hypothetical protein